MPSRVIEQFRRAAHHHGGGLGDGELLGRFIARRDEAALAALVQRHGPMVWGVCRRSLSHHDAEDAFQATFLVLVRKAAKVAPREMVGNWLYGVAHQTALQARRTAARRTAREVQMKAMPDAAEAPLAVAADVQSLLDHELSHLPEMYRAVIVLCDLEGRTRREVAVQLGCPEGTVAGRLARARAMLAKRLSQRGVALSRGALATVLTESVASAGMPAALVSSTIEQATGVISPQVATLTEGVLKAMLMSKLKAATAIVLVLGFLATGATGYVYRDAQADEAKPVEVKPTPAAQKGEKLAPATEAKLKWGEPVNGLRAAMAIRLAPGRAKTDKPELYMAIQNVSKEPIRITDIDVPMDVNLRKLRLLKDGKILYGLGVRQPGLGDRLLQPGEVTFLPMFDPDRKLTVPTPNGDTVGSDHAGEALKDARLTFTGEFNIEKAPAKAWTGKLVTGEAGAAAAEIKAELEPKPEPKKENFTGEQAKKLIPAAAGISNADFEALAKNPRADAIKSKSLSLVLFSMPPPANPDADKASEFRFLKDGFSVSDITKAMWLSKGEGYASFIQAKDITRCTCKSTGERAEGVVTFQNDLFAGCFSFVAQATKEGWVITEFRLPHNGIRVIRGEDGLWKQEKDAFTAWGKDVSGLQAGMGFPAEQKRAYRPGETVKLVVRVRNVGKEESKFQYLREFFLETPPAMTDGKGKPVALPLVSVSGLIHQPVDVSLAPGKEIELTGSKPFYELKIDLKPAYGTGKFQIGYDTVFGNSSAGSFKPDPKLSKLATGKLELDVARPKDEKEPENEAYTAWGKEVGGLQAGMGFKAGEQRTYSHGDTVTLVIRVRNVGKKPVMFDCFYPYFTETPPIVTDGDGKPFVHEKVTTLGLPVPEKLELAPGQEIVLVEQKYNLKPASVKDGEERNFPGILKGVGKCQIQYAQLARDADSTLGKLATGKLVLEIKAAEAGKK